ncbi:MAG: hypothetical protein HC840_08380 [Leptolyngbyaceae cyanobacterium RM2_2_4]|nr:hypothetical protein [Leptolyngbyaceae cyanobacterium SM1_4_3]NJN90922.1 hypothetical protein [Leptolyngbyaceae cyanobacterium SL_5_14]NJO49450.1 hypothetical protein [Leptolyngbyaceae cyanobacterium RM2_2_4]
MTTATLQCYESPIRQLTASSAHKRPRLVAQWQIVDNKLICVWNLE